MFSDAFYVQLCMCMTTDILSYTTDLLIADFPNEAHQINCIKETIIIHLKYLGRCLVARSVTPKIPCIDSYSVEHKSIGKNKVHKLVYGSGGITNIPLIYLIGDLTRVILSMQDIYESKASKEVKPIFEKLSFKNSLDSLHVAYNIANYIYQNYGKYGPQENDIYVNSVITINMKSDTQESNDLQN